MISKARGLNRRRFCEAAAASVATVPLALLSSPERSDAMTELAQAVYTGTIRPFRINVPESDLIDLRRRIGATRLPERETVSDESQGVPLAMMQTLMNSWAKHDWRTIERRLNALPQFVTEIDGLDIHFIHVRSKHENALPLIVTHGWPGSVIEQLKIIDPLTNPTAYGASAPDAFHLVIPSLPGYGFSGKPTSTGWDLPRIARAWVLLMKRLGYNKFAAQGGDQGAGVANVMAQQAPPELLGIHTNFPATVPADILKLVNAGSPPPESLSGDELRAYRELAVVYGKRRAYLAFMTTRPQTLYGIADSPAGLAAWMLDHGDGWAQPAAPATSAVLGHTVNGHPAGALTLNDLLDNMSLYWLTNTGVSSARLYWETHFVLNAAIEVAVPAAISVFPGENYQAPRSWTERAYRNLIYFHEADRGGHFAAWEEPLVFSEEVRSGLRSLRTS